MYLKSLTMKGFKSFASATTLHFEPGITCIVGPNGSGKSNVVDALAWVMGEQGAKSLRGGKMEDVIFAGTSARAPLGRAEVALTIDNSDGALPIEYAEVTISRTMFRNGGSEYAINCAPCRLLDVQELLSDSGIGREMHVIVGQGQLDSILHATPEDRRGFIEEAAGVLKHRKRKEKALRKLDSTDANLTRLGDLLSEIRRQLKPLGRQADVARRAAVVQADARDARARLIADDLAGARSALEQEIADESILVERRTEVEQGIAAAREQEAGLEAALREDLPQLARAQETWFALSGLRERLRGTESLAAERIRNAEGQDLDGRVAGAHDPDELEADAARIDEEQAQIFAEVEDNRGALEAAVTTRTAAEQAFSSEEQRVAGLQRAAADRREGLARLHGQVNALRSRSAAAEEEVGRLSAARDAALARSEQATRDFSSLESRIAGLDEGEEGLDAEHEESSVLLSGLEEKLANVRELMSDAERERSTLTARKEALEVGLNRKDGAGALLAATDSVSGMLGSVAAVLSVRSGYEAAVSAALGQAADAIVVRDADAAIGAIERLKTEDLGRAGLLLGGADFDDAEWPGLPEGVVYAVDVVECPDDLRSALARLLFKVAVVEDLQAARALVAQAPDLTAVSLDGDLLGTHFAVGGSSTAPSLIEVQAAVDEAAEQLTGAQHTVERLTFVAQTLEQQRLDARNRVDVALARLHESDATLAAVAEELGQHGSSARSARSEADRTSTQIAAAEEAHRSAVAGLADLEQRLAAAENATDEEPDTARREELAGEARGHRQSEMDARLKLRTAEERARALHGRADGLRTQARSERESREREIARRRRVVEEGVRGRSVAHGVRQVLTRLESSVTAAAQERSEVEAGRTDREQGLAGTRQQLRTLARELDELVNSAHRDEMARTQQRMRIEQLENRALEELGLDPASLVGDFGPDQLVPAVLLEGSEPPGTPPATRPRRPRRRPRGGGRASARTAGRHAVRPGGADHPAAQGRAGARPARPDQPVGAGGVLRAGGAAPLHHRAAGGPQADPERPAGHRAPGRRAGAAGVRRGVRRRRRGVRGCLLAALPRR